MDRYEFSDSSGIEWLESGVSIEHIGVSERTSVDEYDESSEAVFGSPERDLAFWEPASDEYHAGLLTEKYAIEQLFGREIGDYELEAKLASHPWSSDVFGPSADEIGRLCEAFDLSVEVCGKMQLDDLAEFLDGGRRIICPVSGMCLDLGGKYIMPDTSADRLVEVVGMERDEGGISKLYVSDPFSYSHEVSTDVFVKAWNCGNRVGYVIGG